MPLDLALLHAVPLATWAKLFAACGIKKAPKSLADVQATTASPNESLAAALRRVRALSRGDARAALLQAARVLGVATRDWPSDVSSAGLAATLTARAFKDPAIAEVLHAAERALWRREPLSPTRRYVAAKKAEPITTKKALAKLAAAIEAANAFRQATGAVDVTIAEASDDRIVLDIVRPDPPASDLVRDPRGALTSKAWTPLAVDRLTLETGPNGAPILWIATAASELLPAYRAAIGEALYADALLFTSPRPQSLRALQRDGKKALAKARAGHARLRDARVVSVLWDPGREETLTIDGRDVLTAVARDELPSHGLVLAARIRLDFDDGPVDVTLRVPNVVHWDPSPHDAAVHAFVAALSLDAPVSENLVTLAPHDHTAWRWRAALGDALFEALRDDGYFALSTSRALGHPELPGAGRIMLAFTLGASGKYYVVPEERFDAEPWLARAEDLVTYRLDVEKLGAAIARDVGAQGETPAAIERGALIDLGALTVGTAAVWLYLAVDARVTEGLAARLRERSEGAQPVIVVPPGVKLESGCAEVALPSLRGPFGAVLAAVAKAVGVADAMDAWARAPRGTRIAVERKSGRVWLDGVELVGLAESTRVLLRLLVAAAGRPVPGAECDRKLSGAREGTGAAKKAKARFVTGVEKSFALAGKAAPADTESILEGTRAGYRVTVSVWMG